MNKITDYKVNYVELSSCIRKAAIQGKGIDFIFNYDQLQMLVKDYDLLVIPNQIKSKRIGPEDIVFLGEFFKRHKLSWLDHFKYFSSLVFVRTDIPGVLDEEFYQLYEDMKANQLEHPDIDKAETLAKILANYPCYMSAVVSYKNADIKKFGTIAFEIVTKANLVTIDIDNKKYHKPENNNVDPVTTDDNSVSVEDVIIDE